LGELPLPGSILGARTALAAQNPAALGASRRRKKRM